MFKKVVCFIVFMVLVTIVHGENIAGFPEVMKPGAICIDGDELFVTEGTTVSVYCLETFKLKHKFGKKGEGPGEFKYRPMIKVFKDFIFASTMGKMVWFSREGKLTRELKTPARGSSFPVKENFVFLASGFDFKNRRINITVRILNKNLEKIKDIYNGADENVILHLSSDTGKEDKQMTPHYFDVIAADGKIFIADSKKGFFIEVFDHTGKKLNTIQIDTENIPVGDDFKKKAMEKLKQSRNWELVKNNNFIFFKYFPKIKSFSAAGDRLYAQTHKERDNENEFIILDSKGNIIKKLFLPVKDVVYTFRDNAYYYMKDNEASEEWELFKVHIR
jgi:hypothetical protein